jgi:hypothetical protein
LSLSLQYNPRNNKKLAIDGGDSSREREKNVKENDGLTKSINHRFYFLYDLISDF